MRMAQPGWIRRDARQTKCAVAGRGTISLNLPVARSGTILLRRIASITLVFAWRMELKIFSCFESFRRSLKNTRHEAELRLRSATASTPANSGCSRDGSASRVLLNGLCPLIPYQKTIPKSAKFQSAADNRKTYHLQLRHNMLRCCRASVPAK